MTRITKAMLEHQNAMLRSDTRELRAELRVAHTELGLYKQLWSVHNKHLTTMTIATERLSDALSHTIGFVTDPQRRRRQEPDLRTFTDLHEADKEARR